MNFNKCERCGCFFTSANQICPACAPKDNLDMSKLENYLSENATTSLSDICMETGISVKNLNRYLVSEKFSGVLGKQSDSKGNIGINL